MLFSLSVSLSYLFSPAVVSFCQTRSTRLTAVIGGLVTALGILFTSFAMEFKQLYFSYGTVIGKVTTSGGSGIGFPAPIQEVMRSNLGWMGRRVST